MKRFKFIPIALLFFATLILAVSCSKDQGLTAEGDPARPALSVAMDYEAAGEWHNAILDALAEDEDFSATLVSASAANYADKIADIISILTEMPCVACTESYLKQEAMDAIASVASMPTIAEVGDSYYEQEVINAADKEQFHQFSAIMIASKNQSGATVQQNLLAFEAAITEMNGLSILGRSALLGGSTIMRYSDSYWRGVGVVTAHAWHDINNARLTFGLISPWHIMDAIGAIHAICDPGTWDSGLITGVVRVARAAASASAFMKI